MGWALRWKQAALGWVVQVECATRRGRFSCLFRVIVLLRGLVFSEGDVFSDTWEFTWANSHSGRDRVKWGAVT